MNHYDANGNICNCGFGQFNEPVDESLVKEAGAKLDWIRDREDKFFKTEKGQAIFETLEMLVGRNEKIDPLVPWLWREAKKDRLKPRDVDPRRLDHIADWFASNSPTRRGVDIMQLTTDDLAEKINEWDEELGSKDADMEKAGGEIVHDFGDGWTIRKLTTAEEAKVEGQAMGHCVGGYGSAIEEGRTEVYSLRDKNNAPHATIELAYGEVRQIQGKGNSQPIPEYQEKIGNWLMGMENPPEVYVEKQTATIYPPENVWGLEGYVSGEIEPHYSTESVKVEPRSWQDYFVRGSYDEDYEDPEWEIYPIEHENWVSIVEDIFNDYYGDESVEKATIFDQSLKYGQEYGHLSEEDVKDARNTAYAYVTGRFENFAGYLPAGYRTLYESWKAYSRGQAADIAIGADFINRSTDEPIYEYHGPVEPNPNQGELFGPGRDPNIEFGPLDELPPVEPDVPWNDPKNLDNQAGKFSKFLARLRRNRRANILDEVHQYLDPEVWENVSNPRPILRPEIKNWVSQFITDVLARHGYTDMESWLSLVLTGSLTTYQYSINSDFDVSLFVNAEAFPEWSRAEMIAIMMDECDEMVVPGTTHELQCYVVSNEFRREDLYKPGLRSAYDMETDKWIVPPEKDRAHDVVREMNEATTIALENADKMEKLIRYEPIKAIQFYHQIHRRRKRDMEAGKGDYAPSNISYKMLEQRGLIKQVQSLSKQYKLD